MNYPLLSTSKSSCVQSAFGLSIKIALLTMWVIGATGCSTLSSVGLPFAGSNNRILKSAKQISQAPDQGFLIPDESNLQPLDTYLVAIGDTVFVEPVGFDASIRLPGDQVIQPDGSISIGQFGAYQANQKTVQQIELEVQSIIDSQIRSDLESEYREERFQASQLVEGFDRPELESDSAADAEENEATLERERRIALEKRIAEKIKQNEISVRLVNWESKRIYVLGEVNSPGYFGYTGHQTVLDAILEAGGLSSKANHHQIIVSRPTPCGNERVVMKVCYDQVVQLGDTSTNYQLQPGDRVFVPALTFVEDLKQTLTFNRDAGCTRCAACQLPVDCQN